VDGHPARLDQLVGLAARSDAGAREEGIQPHGCAEKVTKRYPISANFLDMLAVGRRLGYLARPKRTCPAETCPQGSVENTRELAAVCHRQRMLLAELAEDRDHQLAD